MYSQALVRPTKHYKSVKNQKVLFRRLYKIKFNIYTAAII